MSTHRSRESIMSGANYYHHSANPSSSFHRPRAVETRYQGVNQYRDVAFSWYRISVMPQGQDTNIHRHRRVNNSTPNEARQIHIRHRNFLMLANWNQDDDTMILNGVHNIDASEAGQISHSRQEIRNYRNFRLANWNQGDETMILNGVGRDNPTLSEERNIGLTDELIMKHLKTRNCDSKDEKSEICVVCQDGLCQENHAIATLECGHEFHTPCIIQWLKQKNVCPLCNAVALVDAADDSQERNSVLRGR